MKNCFLCSRLMSPLLVSAGYQYWECCDCQIAQVVPMPSASELQTYYSTAYAVDRENYSQRIGLFAGEDLAMLGHPSQQVRLLEIGSSWGLFLDFARQKGWQVAGVELSEPSSTWARENLGLEITSGTLRNSSYPNSQAFDAAVAWHVIEHATDPLEFLRDVRSSLKPDGRVALRTPNIRSLPARLNGSTWEWVGAPAHLSLFSARSLRLALEQTGFRVERIFTRRGDAHNPWFEILRGIALRLRIHTLAKRVMGLRANSSSQCSGKSGDQRRSRLLSKIDRLFDIALFFLDPLEKWGNILGLGAELVVIACRVA